jgi:hypothetical protein
MTTCLLVTEVFKEIPAFIIMVKSVLDTVTVRQE